MFFSYKYYSKKNKEDIFPYKNKNFKIYFQMER